MTCASAELGQLTRVGVATAIIDQQEFNVVALSPHPLVELHQRPLQSRSTVVARYNQREPGRRQRCVARLRCERGVIAAATVRVDRLIVRAPINVWCAHAAAAGITHRRIESMDCVSCICTSSPCLRVPRHREWRHRVRSRPPVRSRGCQPHAMQPATDASIVLYRLDSGASLTATGLFARTRLRGSNRRTLRRHAAAVSTPPARTSHRVCGWNT